jgi:Ni/Co efflux regulator RcnB
MRSFVRSFIVSSAALAAVGFAVPSSLAAHAEETVVIKRDHDHFRDRDRDGHRGLHRDRDERRIYIERRHDDRRSHRDHDRD